MLTSLIAEKPMIRHSAIVSTRRESDSLALRTTGVLEWRWMHDEERPADFAALMRAAITRSEIDVTAVIDEEHNLPMHVIVKRFSESFDGAAREWSAVAEVEAV